MEIDNITKKECDIVLHAFRADEEKKLYRVYKIYYGAGDYGYVYRFKHNYYCVIENLNYKPYVNYVYNDENEAIDTIKNYCWDEKYWK